ncbi:fumarylacetoacetate hydrolase family protein [Actinomycetospora straminea]|uniref:Fumarylacetoacetate hydrolase family protein n=1 Tax=Actinomycetospora straminea TaxID=663607 RepID=A0ABP9E774_9PSEU
MSSPSSAAHVDQAAVLDAAARLISAADERRPCPPVRDLIGRDDVRAAYAVQSVLHERALAAGRRVAGRKIGLTAPAVQAQLGVDQPDFGVLYADMDVTADATRSGVETTRLLQPKIEAEVAFVLAKDLHSPTADGTFRAEELADAIAAVVPALEIVDSRVAGWDISFGDTVADNASSGLYVLGTDRAEPDLFGPDLDAGLAAVSMTMMRGDAADAEQVSAGHGADCLGSPLRALAWLASTAVRFGDPLRAGQVVLAGALGPMVPVAAGDTFRADITGLGSVAARFTPSSREHS